MKITEVEVLILEAPGHGYESPQGAEGAYGMKFLGNRQSQDGCRDHRLRRH